MIVYEVNKSGHRFGAAVLLCLIALGLAWWAWPEQNAEEVQAHAPAGVNLHNTARDTAQNVTPAPDDTGMSTPLRFEADGRPSEVTPDDWLALSHALAGVHQGQQAATRIVDYLAYQQDFERWQSLDGPSTETLRRHMAQALLNQLPERLARGDFTPAEATMMGTVLIAEIEVDDGARQKRIDTWNKQILNKVNQPGADSLAPERDRLTLLKRKQSEAFSDWQISNSARRDAERLAQGMLNAQRWYDSGAPE